MHHRVWFFALVPFLLASCASKETRENLDKKLEAQKGISTSDEMTNHVREAIQSSPTLSDQQRAQLFDLHRRTHSELERLSNDSIRLRHVLVNDITGPDYNAGEINLIKKRLRETEDKKVDTILAAVDEAATILGHADAENARVLRAFDEFGDNVR